MLDGSYPGEREIGAGCILLGLGEFTLPSTSLRLPHCSPRHSRDDDVHGVAIGKVGAAQPIMNAFVGDWAAPLRHSSQLA